MEATNATGGSTKVRPGDEPLKPSGWKESFGLAFDVDQWRS
jgi:hypothetical protein